MCPPTHLQQERPAQLLELLGALDVEHRHHHHVRGAALCVFVFVWCFWLVALDDVYGGRVRSVFRSIDWVDLFIVWSEWSVFWLIGVVRFTVWGGPASQVASRLMSGLGLRAMPPHTWMGVLIAARSRWPRRRLLSMPGRLRYRPMSVLVRLSLRAVLIVCWCLFDW